SFSKRLSASAAISNGRSTAERSSSFFAYPSAFAPAVNCCTRAAACRISSRSVRGSGGIKHRPLPIDGTPKPGIADGLGRDEINLAAEQVFQPVQQAEIGIGPRTGLQGLEFDKEIQVARRRIELAAHGR